MAKINYEEYTKDDLIRLIKERDRKPRFGLVWERDEIDHDKSLNDDFVVLEHDANLSVGEVPHQNLIIEGDNFDALRYLKMTHAGKIKCIYIDPPYNTGNKDFIYNDHFLDKDDVYKHSKWLEFMHRRLVLAKDLLAEDGVILASINDENRARLELLMDNVFPGMRLGSLVWRTKDTGNDLAQRFSHVHEHVLVYAGTNFKFAGRATDRSKFRNSDSDPRGDWSPQPLTKAHTYKDRKNTYYPIQDPTTGYWYPCDPNSVWRFASENEIRSRFGDNEIAIENALNGLRSHTIEQLIDNELIYFPYCKPSDVMQYNSKADLISAIKAGGGPVLPKKKTQLLREDLPDIDFWIGKPIATGRPSRKEHWLSKPEDDRIAPLSSWIAGINEDIESLSEFEDDEPVVLRSTRGGVGTEEIKDVFGEKVFSHPKPLSLIMGLLAQACRPNDLALDFFAGSGTTAHAILKLNAEDGGARKFILVSSTEATHAEPDKNICRDVCSERLKRITNGYNNAKGEKIAGLAGSFAYLRTKRIPLDHVFHYIKHEQVWLALQLIHLESITHSDNNKLVQLAGSDGSNIAYISKLTEESMIEAQAIAKATTGNLTIYSWQPGMLRQYIEQPNITFETIPQYLIDRFAAGNVK